MQRSRKVSSRHIQGGCRGRRIWETGGRQDRRVARGMRELVSIGTLIDRKSDFGNDFAHFCGARRCLNRVCFNGWRVAKMLEGFVGCHQIGTHPLPPRATQCD